MQGKLTKMFAEKEVSGMLKSLQSLTPSNCVCCSQPSHQSQQYDQHFNCFELWKVSVVSLKMNTTEYYTLQWELTGLWHWRLFVCLFVCWIWWLEQVYKGRWCYESKLSNLCDLLSGFKFIRWYWKKKKKRSSPIFRGLSITEAYLYCNNWESAWNFCLWLEHFTYPSFPSRGRPVTLPPLKLHIWACFVLPVDI